MPAQIISDVQAALVALLAARPGLNGVQVTDGYAGDDAAQPERIFTGDARADDTPAGLKAGRTHYQERGEFDVVVQVVSIDQTLPWTKARAEELGAEVTECVADNRTLGSVPGLNFVVTSRWDLRTAYAQRGVAAEIVYTLRYEARLT